MIRPDRSIALLLALVSSKHLMAYDAETHGLIMYAAYARSSLTGSGTGSLVANLGLDRLDVQLPFNAYWDSTAVPTLKSPRRAVSVPIRGDSR
jgi:hypothetical protein